MAKRPKSRRQAPVIDDEDVQKVADLFLSCPDRKCSDEETVRLAVKAAEIYGYRFGQTAAWRKALMLRVKQRVEWALMAQRDRRSN